MAKYNPFFEKAGMHKIAESKTDKAVTEALAKPEKLGFDPMLLGSTTYNHKIIEQTGTQAIIAIQPNSQNITAEYGADSPTHKAHTPNTRNSHRKSPAPHQSSLQKP